ncbi:unnamed protein product [Oncorhynchus mykiss]|uniref:DUF5641 domain-containing protein n=1 Tax=Oncorhynchus mykiss TaxID=8022 RepID=A0A060Z1H3_ONCMY|nr:unnamed protein product [Oncorhynchus mykiss]
MTPPRLELMGAVIGARLAYNLMTTLKMEEKQIKMWTDSMIVLHWICSSAQKCKQFVANRVTEIQSLTNPESWSHIEGKTNPADLPTRGQTVRNLTQSELWWNGPRILTSPNQSEETDDNKVPEEVNIELKSSCQVTVQLAENSTDITEPVLELERYSKLKRVFRVTAWIKRFIANARTTIKMQGELTADELFDAEKYWIKVTQQQSFGQEIKLPKAGKSLNNDCKIRELKPFLDEHELLSVGGRLQQSNFTFREQHPWVLPNKYRYSEMLIQYHHEKVMHSGASDTQHPTLNKEELTRRWKYRQRLVTSFWNCWQRDYLLDLKSAHRCDTPQPTPLKAGDVVLIGEDNTPRQTWKLGKIEELFPGRDGLVISCSVRTASGTLLRRPIQLIYCLEI